MEKVKYGSLDIEYDVKRGKRKKTIAVQVASASQVIVLAPIYLKDEKIREIIKKKAKWIIEKQNYHKKIEELFPPKEFVSGEQILYQGRKYRLKVVEKKDDFSDNLAISGRKIVATVDPELNADEKKAAIKKAILKWYLSETDQIIRQRTKRYIPILDVMPRKIEIKDQEKRWGSCSSKSVLRFNWRIIMAPISIIDYVVVHELCHLKAKNHSPAFWRLVSLAVPDYRKRRDWLRKNSAIFRL